MGKLIEKIFVILITVVFIASCSAKIDAMQKDYAQNQVEISKLKKENKKLIKEIDMLKQNLEQRINYTSVLKTFDAYINFVVNEKEKMLNIYAVDWGKDNK